MTDHRRGWSLLLCLLCLRVAIGGAATDVPLFAWYGTPVIDGTVTPGEWPGFTELNLTITQATGITPPPSSSSPSPS